MRNLKQANSNFADTFVFGQCFLSVTIWVCRPVVQRWSRLPWSAIPTELSIACPEQLFHATNDFRSVPTEPGRAFTSASTCDGKQLPCFDSFVLIKTHSHLFHSGISLTTVRGLTF